jgi:hypothetical protein
MPADSEQEFIPDRRGNRLEQCSFSVESDEQSHRLYLRASPEIAAQFLEIGQPRPAYRPSHDHGGMPRQWTHCLTASGCSNPMAADLADLLSEVITLPRLPDVAFAIAMDWYKIPADDIDPRDWRNTLDGYLVQTGKYWKSSPEAMAAAGRMLARRMAAVARRHPILAEADVVVPAPGHDRSYVSFGDRLGASVANSLGVTLIKVATRHDFRPPMKELQTGEHRALTREFSLAQDLAGAVVLIVDDVLHTGATMSAVASAAMQAGATRTCGLVAARTVRSS